MATVLGQETEQHIDPVRRGLAAHAVTFLLGDNEYPLGEPHCADFPRTKAVYLFLSFQ